MLPITKHLIQIQILIHILIIINTSFSAVVREKLKHESRGILQMIGINLHGTDCHRPPSDFPPRIPLKREFIKDPFRKLPNKLLWKAMPRTLSQVVTLTNWAFINDYALHSVDLINCAPSLSSSIWSPKYIQDTNCSRTLLIDASKYLTKMKMVGVNLVTVETGVKMKNLLDFLEDQEMSLPISPVPGHSVLSIGEALSIGAYGIGVNSHKENTTLFFHTVSSLVMSFKTIVYDRIQDTYILKRFDRPDPRSFAFLTNLGRSFITEVTFLVQPSYQLRCQTFSEFTSENLFANPNSTSSLTEESFAYLVEEFGKVEVTYVPYIDRSWVKIWTKIKKRPIGSLKVNKKYLSGALSPIMNFANILATKTISIFPSLAPTFSSFLFDMGVARMRLSGASDIYGTSHDTYFTFTNDTETYNSKGYVVLTSRNEIQSVVHNFFEQFSLLRDQLKQQGKYPISNLYIRVSGIDSMNFKGHSKGSSKSFSLIPPAFSVLSPITNHPEFDVAVIFEMDFLPNDSSGEEFLDEFEPWIYANFQGNYAVVRPLWSTEWRHHSGSFKGHEEDFKQLIRHSYGPAWNKAIKVLDFYDPFFIYRNPFFDSLAEL